MSSYCVAQEFVKHIGGGLRDHVALATVVGIFILVWMAETAFLFDNEMSDPVVVEFVKDFHQIIILAAGGGLVFLGIRSKS